MWIVKHCYILSNSSVGHKEEGLSSHGWLQVSINHGHKYAGHAIELSAYTAEKVIVDSLLSQLLTAAPALTRPAVH